MPRILLFILIGSLDLLSPNLNAQTQHWNVRFYAVEARFATYFSLDSPADSGLVRRYYRVEDSSFAAYEEYRVEGIDTFRVHRQGFYPDGGIRFDYRYNGRARWGEQREWYPNGQLKTRYTLPWFEGTWQHWYPNGQRQVEGHYARGEACGWQTFWRQDGSILWRRFAGEGPFQPTDTVGSPFPPLATMPDLEQEAFPTNTHDVIFRLGYPRVAADAGIMGNVLFRVYVSEHGQIQDFHLLRYAHPLLVNHFVRALLDLQFSPSRREGKAVGSWVNLPFKVCFIN